MRVFLSSRRDDAAGHAGRRHDGLLARSSPQTGGPLGKDSIVLRP